MIIPNSPPVVIATPLQLPPAPMAAAAISITECTPSLDNYLFDVTFNSHQIKTTVTADASVASAWVAAAKSSNHRLIGLDIEWRPNTSRQVDNPAATLQLCVGPTCLIFQLLHCPPPLPESLVEFLADEENTFVGVGIEADAEKLVGDHELVVKRAVDLADLTADGGRRNLGLKEMARTVMGVEVVKPKSVTMSRWDAEWLSYQQIQYACVDAFLSFEIGRRLLASSSDSNTQR